MMKRLIIFLATILLVAAGFPSAGNLSAQTAKTIVLPADKANLAQGEGRAKTEAFCAICHSTDYITMQPRASKAQWTGEVNKMIKVFGAPINEAEAEIIAKYISANYGNGK